MLNSCLKVPRKWKKAFNPKLYLVFQEKVKDSERDRIKKKGAKRFKMLIEVCKAFENMGGWLGIVSSRKQSKIFWRFA